MPSKAKLESTFDCETEFGFRERIDLGLKDGCANWMVLAGIRSAFRYGQPISMSPNFDRTSFIDYVLGSLLYIKQQRGGDFCFSKLAHPYFGVRKLNGMALRDVHYDTFDTNVGPRP